MTFTVTETKITSNGTFKFKKKTLLLHNFSHWYSKDKLNNLQLNTDNLKHFGEQ